MPEAAVESKPLNGDAVPGGAPLAKAPADGGDVGKILGGQSAAQIIWDKDRVEVIKRQVCPFGISDDEFLLFMLTCQRTGTDPLMGECFCVPRKVTIKKGNYEEKVVRNVYQIAEQGLEARADRHEDYLGTSSGAYYSNDQIEIDFANGKVKHLVTPNKDRGKLMGAWAIAKRAGREPFVAEVKLSERIQTFPSGDPVAEWKKQPDHMIEKCARAESLRKAYPNTFSGIFISAELPEMIEKDVTPPAGPARTDDVAKRVADKAGRTVDAPKQAQAPAPTPSQPAEPVSRFGEHKGKKLSALSMEQLREIKEKAEAALVKKENAEKDWLPALRENLKEIDAEISKRGDAAINAAIPEREPGSDDGDIPEDPLK